MKFSDIKKDMYLVCTQTLGFTNKGEVVKVVRVTPDFFFIQCTGEALVFQRNSHYSNHYEPCSSLQMELL